MTDPRMNAVLAAVTARFPGTRIEVRPNPDPATATGMPDFAFILDVPPERGYEVSKFALEVAFAVFGDEPIPFLVGTVDPVQSAQCFPPATAGHLSKH
jgi:hypothetical protein